MTTATINDVSSVVWCRECFRRAFLAQVHGDLEDMDSRSSFRLLTATGESIAPTDANLRRLVQSQRESPPVKRPSRASKRLRKSVNFEEAVSPVTAVSPVSEAMSL